MGFLQLVRSVEDLIYEIMSWLIFYPRTFWSVLRHPVQMIDYSDAEQSDTPSEQYTDTLSPPLFLVLSIVLSHSLELAFKTRVEIPRSQIAALFSNTDETLILFRTVLFSIYPLIFAVGLLKRSGQNVERKSLRGPFFSQCYLGALFAMLISICSIMARAKLDAVEIAGLALGALTVIWFVTIQAMWFREHLATGRLKATWIAVGTFFKASFFNGLIAALLFA